MPAPHDNLAARLLESALQRGWGGRPALRQGERVWTYAELADQVARLATVLRALDIQRGERVAVLMRDSLEAAAVLLGIMHAGAVAVPLSELARPLDIRKYLLHCGASAAFVHGALEPAVDEIRSEVTSLRQVICVGGAGRAGIHDFGALMAEAVPATQAAVVRTTDAAMLIYTALGLEEDFRGIPHNHATPLAAFDSFGRGVIGLDADDRVFSVVRLSTTFGLSTGLIFPLAAGAETMFLPDQPHSEAILSTLQTFDPTVFVATPSIYGQLARDAEVAGLDRPLGRCRACLSGAEGMPPKLVPKIRDVLGAEVTVGYGLTEAFQFVFAGMAGDGPLGRTGRPVPGFEARIIDDEGKSMGPDVIGTLQIRGPTVLRNYWGEEQFEDQFQDGWFTTRDRFMMDEEGNYYHCGRLDDLFKVGGKWVSPIEVERALSAHEAVWDCAVIGADDEDGLIKPYAFVVPNIGHEPDKALKGELREYVKSVLAPYKYPRWFEFRERLPRGPGGKLLRYKLKPLRKERRAETGGEGPPQ
jgi:benzoate-CoA ligase family protein